MGAQGWQAGRRCACKNGGDMQKAKAKQIGWRYLDSVGNGER